MTPLCHADVQLQVRNDGTGHGAPLAPAPLPLCRSFSPQAAAAIATSQPRARRSALGTQNSDSISPAHRAHRVVGHHQRRDLLSFYKMSKGLSQRTLTLGIHAREGLIQQQDRGVGGERSPQAFVCSQRHSSCEKQSQTGAQRVAEGAYGCHGGTPSGAGRYCESEVALDAR